MSKKCKCEEECDCCDGCTCDCCENKPPMIGGDAPAFKANTTQGEINFPGDFAGKWIILFSHPADFTPVCTTEFMTFASMAEEFEALNVQLVGLSVDSIYAHIAWLRKIQDIDWNGMSNVEVKFPLIEDIKMDVAKKYGMIQPAVSDIQAVRSVFFIDPNGKIRAMIHYPPSLGRNFAEIKRVIVALQKADAENIATPANWMPGDDVILPAPGSCGTAKERMDSKDDDKICYDWFLCFRKDKPAKPLKKPAAKRGPKKKV
jgi:peroxiredoxin (alkyl hydroperoxide reductase subunit C)